MSAFLPLLAAALIASAGADSDREPPTPTSLRADDAAPGLISPFESWDGLDPELVRLPGAAAPVASSAGSA